MPTWGCRSVRHHKTGLYARGGEVWKWPCFCGSMWITSSTGPPPEIHVILKFRASDFNQQHKINRVTLFLACLHHAYIITSSGAYHSFSFLSVEILCRDSFWHSVTGCRSSFQRCCRDKRCQWRQIRALPCSVYSVARLVQERFS